MSKRWVVNASPLILLQKIGHLKLLTDLCEEVIIPQGVVDELSPEGIDLVWQLFFASSEKITLLKEPVEINADVSGWDLGKGESEVISFAIKNPGYESILDDLEARKCAETFNIPLRGTVGIILYAKKKGIVAEAKPLIESLKNAGLWFSEDWLKNALNLVGE